MRKNMFSSLKLNSLKCQSNGGDGDDNTRNKSVNDDDGGDELSDHMYEKLPNFESRKCKCHLDHFKRASKPSKNSFTKRISKWRMECPGITNLRNSHVTDDGHESQNNHSGRIVGISNSGHTVRTKITTVNIEREDGNLGITLKGGFYQDSDLSRSVIITYVKPDGPAARQGTINPGDRLLAVDGISLQGSTLSDAQTLLRQPSATALLTIEYNVNVLDSVEHANGPLLVEIEKTCTQQLGLTLLQNEDGTIIIERIKPGSLADRCGALHVGDKILAVNAIRIDETSIGLDAVVKILECEHPIVRLEILPSNAVNSTLKCGIWKTRDFFESTPSTSSTLKGTDSIRKNRDCRKGEDENGTDYKLNHLNSHGICGAEIALTHSETLHTTLTRENGGFGLQFVDAPDGSVLINSVTPDGPAERSQCLHPGDRVLSVNHRNVISDNLTAESITELMESKTDDSLCSKLSLHTEFDVLDTVVPSSGIFLVKLVKRGSAGLGITMTASKSLGFIVCEMKKGSIAHRAGSLVPGDRLLAINNVPLDECSVEYAAHIFHNSTNIITLKVQREGNSDFRNCGRKITYAVDLQRYGGPLGITIAGSEERSHPITVSGLTAGGLAEQTGVIHVGDEILAINNHSLLGEPLSRAHALLQNSPDLVTLKLSRCLMQSCRLFNDRSPILPSSVDSAVESWDSSHLDLAPSPDPLRESHDGGKRIPNSTQHWPSLETDYQSTIENSSLGQRNSNLAILDKITSENLKIKHELDLLSSKLDEQRKSKPTQNESNSNLFLANNGATLPGENLVKPQETASKNCNNVERKDKNAGEENREERRSVCSNSCKDLDADCAGRESLTTADFEKLEMAYLPETRNWCKNQYSLGCDGIQGSIRSEFQSSHLYEVILYKDPIYEDFGFSVSDGLYEKGVFINRIRKGGPADLSNVLKPYDRILQVNKTNTQDFDCCLTVPLMASAGDCLILLVARNPGNSNSDNECFNFVNFSSKDMEATSSSSSSIKIDSHNHEESRRILV